MKHDSEWTRSFKPVIYCVGNVETTNAIIAIAMHKLSKNRIFCHGRDITNELVGS